MIDDQPDALKAEQDPQGRPGDVLLTAEWHWQGRTTRTQTIALSGAQVAMLAPMFERQRKLWVAGLKAEPTCLCTDVMPESAGDLAGLKVHAPDCAWWLAQL